MTDWTKTNYGTPKSWNEIQREKLDAEHDQVINGPGTRLSTLVIGFFVAAIVTVACFIGLIYLLLR